MTKYRGYTIEIHHPPGYRANVWYKYIHKDYDGASDSGDTRCGIHVTVEGCRECIDMLEDE